jgi:probable phosphoglycerate mutase
VTTILLARHGETDWNRELRFQGRADPPLNEAGRGQARELADRLDGWKIDAVYTSPLLRARETAEIVAERLGLPVRVEPAFCEIDVGSWQGLTRAEVEERDPEAFRSWIHGGAGWADGESYEQMTERFAAGLDRVAAAHPDGTILLVTHGGPLRAAQVYALGCTFEEARRHGPPVHNCSLFELRVGERGFRRLD